MRKQIILALLSKFAGQVRYDTKIKLGGQLCGIQKKEASSDETDYELEILDIFVKSITKYGDDLLLLE